VTENAASTAEAPGFSVSVSEAGDGRFVVAAAGELDIASAPLLLGAITRLAQPGGAERASAIAIDLSALTFIDSSGINALRTAIRSANARGVGAILAAPSERIQKVLELVKLGDILPLEHSLQAAFERLDSAGTPGPPSA
jgi:anti-anti-sigma factor